MKRFLEMQRKQLVILLIPLILVLSVVLWFFLGIKESPQTQESKLLSPKGHAGAESKKGEDKLEEALMTYQPKSSKDPFKPLIDMTAEVQDLQDGNLPPELPSDLPPISGESPLPLEHPDNLSPIDPTPLSGEGVKKLPVLKGIIQDEKGFSALLNIGEESLIVQNGEQLEGIGQVVSIGREKVVLQNGPNKTILEIGRD